MSNIEATHACSKKHIPTIKNEIGQLTFYDVFIYILLVYAHVIHIFRNMVM